MSGLVALIGVWLAFVLPLVGAAVGRHRLSTKISALIVLAIVLVLNWFLARLLFSSDDQPSFTPLQIALPLMTLFVAVASISLRRKGA